MMVVPVSNGGVEKPDRDEERHLTRVDEEVGAASCWRHTTRL